MRLAGKSASEQRCTADSYVLTPDGVNRYVDFNYPGRVPPGYIISTYDMTGWVDFLRHAPGENWQFANLAEPGNGQGYWRECRSERTGTDSRRILEQLCRSVSRDHGQQGLSLVKNVAHSEVIRTHPYKVLEDSFLNNNPAVGVVKPLFTPIESN